MTISELVLACEAVGSEMIHLKVSAITVHTFYWFKSKFKKNNKHLAQSGQIPL